MRFNARGDQTQWPPLTENTNFRKIAKFIKFPLICLNNLKFAERRKPDFFFHLKFSYVAHFPALFGRITHYAHGYFTFYKQS